MKIEMMIVTIDTTPDLPDDIQRRLTASERQSMERDYRRLQMASILFDMSKGGKAVMCAPQDCDIDSVCECLERYSGRSVRVLEVSPKCLP